MIGYSVIKNEYEKWQFSQGGYRTVTEGFGLQLLNLMEEVSDQDLSAPTLFPFIKDRDYPTEWVYNLAMGVEPNTKVLQRMDRAHSTLDTKIIYCERRSYESVGYSDQLVDISYIAKIKRIYREFLSATLCKHFTVYLEDGTPEQNADRIVEWLKGL